MKDVNRLYFGDNLHVLREHVADESVDLVYLDPPFNSKRDYNLLFKTPKGHESDAQITAFEDSWHWGEQAEREYAEILRQPNTDVAELMPALRAFLGENDMMAYLVMMANRLLELHRVLKATGSLYLHCDPTASHYLKIVLDGVFGKANFRTEISWKRSSAHNDAKQGRAQYGNIRDVIFFYAKSDDWKWNWQYTPYSQEYVDGFYNHVEKETGRRYQLDNLTAAKPGGDVSYEFYGTKPYKGRYWAYSRENMEKFKAEGRLYFPKDGGTPRYKRYLDEMPGVPLQNDWDDIKPTSAGEYLGYSTQKPLALLERIIQASSKEGDVVLDPFCGCGTAVDAAQKLGRRWIGIDITHLAIALIEKRLKDRYPYLNRTKPEKVAASASGVAEPVPDYMQSFEVIGTPEDLDGARDLAARDKYQFQWWACSLVNAQPYQGKKKGADGGIDGLIFFQDDKNAAKKIVVSVKGGDNVNVAMVRDLAHVVAREKAEIGLFVTLAEPSKPMVTEAVKEGFYVSPQTGAQFPKIQILTIAGLLDGSERARYPDLAQGGHTFKKARRDSGKETEQGSLL
ncbi:MAG TPA: DNA methyltransferase [Rhodanobacteraceae bacterium]|nr:DNA methyltransferase [Rhodanobacteraceae bacterium]